jgi:hypothetical protein
MNPGMVWCKRRGKSQACSARRTHCVHRIWSCSLPCLTGKGWGWGHSFLFVFLLACLLGSLLAGCTSPPPTLAEHHTPAVAQSPSPVHISTATHSPTPTDTLQPTWTQTPTNTPTLTPSPTDDPLAALRLTRLDRYTDIHPVEQVALQTAGWSRYTFDPLDARCIYGDDYFVLARPGRDPTKTVFWMEGGGACWPGQEACANHGRISPWVEEDGWAS